MLIPTTSSSSMNFFSSLNLKPFQIILMALFAFFAAAGLILFATYGGLRSPSARIGEVTIWGTLPGERMEVAIGVLRAGSQEYGQVNYVEMQEATFDVDLAEAIASGVGPDLILISQEQLTTEQNKISVIPFSTISQRKYLDTYLPINELFLASDGTYGIPFVVDPLVLYYNRSIITQAGIAAPPTSWEAVTSLSERISQSSAGALAQSTVPFGVYDNVENARAIVSLLLLQAGNPISTVGSNGVRGTLGDANDGGNVPAQSALSFYTQFADPVKTVYSWNREVPSARQAFLAGTLAFYPGFASELPSLKNANPNLDFDMAPIPQPQTGALKQTYGKAYAFAVPRTSPNAKGAVASALAFADPSLAAKVSEALFMAPATRSSLTPSSADRYAPIYFPQALIARGWLSPSPQDTDRIFSTMISNITSGRAQLGQALGTANQALNASF